MEAYCSRLLDLMSCFSFDHDQVFFEQVGQVVQ